MSEPLVFISRNRVKAGMLDEFSKHYEQSIPMTQAAKPATFVQVAYVSEDGNDVTIVRLFAGAEGLDKQLQGADDRSKAAYQYIEPVSVEIYGTPSEFALEMMKKVAGAGTQVSLHPLYLGGFLRVQPGE